MPNWARQQLDAIERAIFAAVIAAFLVAWLALGGRYLWAPIQAANLQLEPQQVERIR